MDSYLFNTNLTLYQPHNIGDPSLACNLLKHSLDKVLLGFHSPNWTQDCTQPS